MLVLAAEMFKVSVILFFPAGKKGSQVSRHRVSWLDWHPCLLLAYATAISPGWAHRYTNTHTLYAIHIQREPFINPFSLLSLQ